MGKLLFVDTETGGLVPESSDLLSIGVAIYDEETGEIEQQEEFRLLGEPERCHEKALAVNKIDLAEWNNQPGVMHPHLGISKFGAWLTDYLDPKITLVGHNVQFDARFLRYVIEHQMPGFWDKWFDYHMIDTMSIGYALTGKKKLDDLLLHFSIEMDDNERHTALGDCLVTMKLYKNMQDYMCL